MNILKELTGGDEIYANVKYKPPFSFKYRGFLWYNCNDLPKFGGDTGKHVYERFIIVDCNNVIPEEKRDPYLLEKMLTEKDIVASVCIQYFKKAIKRGYKFIESEAIDINRSLYEKENNNLFTFVRDNCRIGIGKILRTEFYTVYLKWCKTNNFKAFGKTECYRFLNERLKVETVKSNGYNYYPLEIDSDFLSEQNELYDKLRFRN